MSFGGQRVLRSVDLDLVGGQIVLLRGPNGSGKTTLLNVLSGFLRPEAGSAYLDGPSGRVEICSTAPDVLARAGIGRLWQEIRLFSGMTVLENVLAASPHSLGLNPATALLAWGRVQRQEAGFRRDAIKWLETVKMHDRLDSSADMLSMGQSKRVAIARLLHAGARVLLLDEPLAGLDPGAAAQLVEDLSLIADTTAGIMLIVEHQHEEIAPICDIQLTLEDGLLSKVECERQ